MGAQRIRNMHHKFFNKKLLLLPAIAIIGTLLASCGPAPPPPPPPTFIVYGDSLSQESATHLFERLNVGLPGWQLINRTYGGTAQCDWHDEMIDDQSKYNVKAVVIAFVGNNLTPCIQSRPYAQAYLLDADWAIRFYADRSIPVTFLAAPEGIGRTPESRNIPNVYKYVTSGRANIEDANLFIDPATGLYEQNLPCLVGECTSYINSRAPDHYHLCLVQPSASNSCPVYSSGVTRYVEMMIQGLGHIGAFATPPARTMINLTPPTTTPPTTTPPTTAPPTTAPTTTAPTTTAPPTTAPPTSNFLLKTSSISSSTIGNQYRYETIANTGPLLISPGDKLEYDIKYTTSDPQIGIDFTNSEGKALRDSGALDQNNFSAHPGTNLNAKAFNTWYTRKITIPNSMHNTWISTFDIAFERDTNSAEASLKNIKIIDSNGNLKLQIYPLLDSSTPSFKNHFTTPALTAFITHSLY